MFRLIGICLLLQFVLINSLGKFNFEKIFSKLISKI